MYFNTEWYFINKLNIIVNNFILKIIKYKHNPY